MKKDPRIASIQRGETLEKCFYVLLFLLLLVFLAMDADGADAGHLFLGCVVAMAGIHVRSEMRNMRLEAIRRENAERAERAGLAMPRLYEDVDDLTDALHKLNAKPPSPPKYNGGAKTTVCPSCAHCMAVPTDYARNEAKCGSCGHVYKL